MSFLLDRKFSEQYEEYFAEISGLNWLHSTTDDHGVDLYSTDMETVVDVKCYATPRFVKHFTGVFIETLLPRSGCPGWFTDGEKLTTHYIMAQDCSRERVSYYRSWYIARDALQAAVEEAEAAGDLEIKAIKTAEGFILPYKYLDKYCQECWWGDKHEETKAA